MSNRIDLDGRTAAVTGGAQGIGRAIRGRNIASIAGKEPSQNAARAAISPTSTEGTVFDISGGRATY